MFVFSPFVKKNGIWKTLQHWQNWILRCKLQVPVVRLHTGPVGFPAGASWTPAGSGGSFFMGKVVMMFDSGRLTKPTFRLPLQKILNFDSWCFEENWQRNLQQQTGNLTEFQLMFHDASIFDKKKEGIHDFLINLRKKFEKWACKNKNYSFHPTHLTSCTSNGTFTINESMFASTSSCETSAPGGLISLSSHHETWKIQTNGIEIIEIFQSIISIQRFNPVSLLKLESSGSNRLRNAWGTLSKTTGLNISIYGYTVTENYHVPWKMMVLQKTG